MPPKPTKPLKLNVRCSVCTNVATFKDDTARRQAGWVAYMPSPKTFRYQCRGCTVTLYKRSNGQMGGRSNKRNPDPDVATNALAAVAVALSTRAATELIIDRISACKPSRD